ncbi:hypothetical protein PIIN_11021 [Serendipita indica DSM 11827]|uniref:Uncharacterized protein n=1 Tax=Serendipita indica (strain DSM 11827) TaxID=1109443 RepID=G4U0E3_SERID|nr:hypothetical protein PIIN_11021 [Serendipita indica DSM 11827]
MDSKQRSQTMEMLSSSPKRRQDPLPHRRRWSKTPQYTTEKIIKYLGETLQILELMLYDAGIMEECTRHAGEEGGGVCSYLPHSVDLRTD